MGFMGKINYTNTLHAELTALMQGLRLAVSNNLMPLEVYTDSTKVLQCINKDNLNYENIICECRSLLTVLGHPQVNHSYREANRVADKLAKEAGKMAETRTNFLIVPLVLSMKQYG
ncbi:uncharacterized protein LOC142169618 [Nicotiana tabacum]|uniref:Uncharacterized protein LOC142169618 n=1 Tax=Nicotiana tabacum TaxID=4097 RepID=A0AC58SRK8_TOBAC